MGQFLNNRSLFTRAGGNNPASDPTDYMRKAEYEVGLSGRAAIAHDHTFSDITDFDSGVQTYGRAMLADSDTVEWDKSDPDTITANVRNKSSGGLLSDADGEYVDTGSGTGQIASADWVKSVLHDPVTLAASDSIDASLVGQELSLEVRVAADGGIIISGDGSGLLSNWGTGHNQISRGDHTHAQLHDAATVQDSTSIDFTLTGQQIGGAVILKPLASLTSVQGQILCDASGLYASLGPSGTQAAPGNHTHADANANESGFLSAELYRQITNQSNLVQIDNSVLFQRHDALIPTHYVGGRRRWGQAMQILYMDLTAASPTAECLLGLEIDGSVVENITIPAGSNHEECVNYKALDSIFVDADTYVRIISISGTEGVATTSPENEPTRINLTLGVRPALAAVDTIQINAGGDAQSPFSADQYYSGGFDSATTTACDTSGVTDPAPQNVYLSARRSDSTDAIYYTVTGLARGIDYLVRLHFNSWLYTGIDDETFNIYIIAATTQTTFNYDIVEQAGDANTGVVKEYTAQADSNGQIQIKLLPQAGNGGHYGASICGVELVPQV